MPVSWVLIRSNYRKKVHKHKYVLLYTWNNRHTHKNMFAKSILAMYTFPTIFSNPQKNLMSPIFFYSPCCIPLVFLFPSKASRVGQHAAPWSRFRSKQSGWEEQKRLLRGCGGLGEKMMDLWLKVFFTSVGWWLHQPIWKILGPKWVHLPQIGMKVKKYLSCHHLGFRLLRVVFLFFL